MKLEQSYRVEVHFLESKVLQKDTRVGIHIRPRVLRLSLLEKDVRSDLKHRLNELKAIRTL